MTVSVAVFPNSRIRHMKIEGDTPSQTALIVQGALGQTAPSQEWRDSAGVTKARVANDGSYQIVYPGDELNASSIVSRAGFAPDSLAIIGAGTLAGARSVIVYDNLDVVAGLTVQGSAVISGGAITLNSILSQGFQGIDWYPTSPTLYGIHRTGEAWTGPDYAQLRLGWPTGIILDPGTAYGKSWLEVRGQTRMYGQAAAAIGLIVRGAASQTGDLQQWENSAGAALAKITSAGHVVGMRDAAFGNVTGPLSATTLSTVARSATDVGLVVRGAASHTANLAQWQGSGGAVLAMVRNDGLIGAPSFRDPTDTGPYLAMSTTSMVATSNTASHNIFSVRAVASQTGDLQRWEDTAAAIQSRVDKNGHIMTRKTAVPADADIATSEAALAWDNRAGSPQLLVKGKDSAGTVLTYAPSRLLGITKYTANGASAVRSAAADIGMSVTFTMPTLQAGQRVKVEALAYYYNFASSTAGTIYNVLVAGTTEFAWVFQWHSTTSPAQAFPPIWGYLDNTQVAAGTSVTCKVQSLSGSGVAYQFIAAAAQPAYISATIV